MMGKSGLAISTRANESILGEKDDNKIQFESVKTTVNEQKKTVVGGSPGKTPQGTVTHASRPLKQEERAQKIGGKRKQKKRHCRVCFALGDDGTVSAEVYDDDRAVSVDGEHEEADLFWNSHEKKHFQNRACQEADLVAEERPHLAAQLDRVLRNCYRGAAVRATLRDWVGASGSGVDEPEVPVRGLEAICLDGIREDRLSAIDTVLRYQSKLREILGDDSTVDGFDELLRGRARSVTRAARRFARQLAEADAAVAAAIYEEEEEP
jgi:hypothetical protein